MKESVVALITNSGLGHSAEALRHKMTGIFLRTRTACPRTVGEDPLLAPKESKSWFRAQPSSFAGR